MSIFEIILELKLKKRIESNFKFKVKWEIFYVIFKMN